MVWDRNHFVPKMQSRSPDARLRCLATAPRGVEVIPTWLSAVASCSNMPLQSDPGAFGIVSAPAGVPATWEAAPDEVGAAVDGATPDGYKRCCTCKMPKPEEQLSVACGARMNCKGEAEKVYRCKECHNLRGRINTVIQNQGLVDDWDFGSEDQKAAFFQKYSGARGSGLSTAVLLHVEERKTDKLVLAFKGTGEFLDLADLTERFKDKPDQLASIKQNGRTIYDKNRGCKLYEVIAYESKSEREQVQTRESKRSLNSESVVKPAKKAKAVKEEPAALVDGNRPLSEGQRTQVVKLKTKFDAATATLEDAIKQTQDNPVIKAAFPDVVLQKAHEVLTAAKDSSQHMAKLIVGKAAVASAKDFMAGVKLDQQKLEKSVGSVTDMLSSISDAAGIDG